jgi:hypothetical protein
MTALLDKKRVLRIRLSQDEWNYLQKQKDKGISYNFAIRKLIQNKLKTKTPF